jgi:HEAT repeats
MRPNWFWLRWFAPVIPGCAVGTNCASSPLTLTSSRHLEPQATFIKRFGDLVALLRVDPGNDAAQELALTAAAAAVADHAIVVESGFEHGVSAEEDLSLQGRLRARRVDLLRVAAGATHHELLQVARALSHDSLFVPSTSAVRVEMMPNVAPAGLALVPGGDFAPPRGESDRRSWRERRQWRFEPWRQAERRRPDDRRVTGERRLRLLKHHEADIGRLQARLAQTVAHASWLDALEAAHALVEHAARVPVSERRSYLIGLRRYLPRHALDAFVELGLLDPAEQGRVADVLRASGLEGADAMMDAVRASPTVGPRRFIHRVLGTMPEAFPSVLPLLSSSELHEVRHAAGILGQMGRLETLPPLKRQSAHPDAGVRRAVLLALAAFPVPETADAFAQALAHASPDTRAAAAEAIGLAHAAAMAMPLAAALGVERDAVAWSAMIEALGLLASAESCMALAAVALARRRFTGGGYSSSRRLEAVRALASVAAPCREPALEQVAREGDGAVRQAASAALTRGSRAAG